MSVFLCAACAHAAIARAHACILSFRHPVNSVQLMSFNGNNLADGYGMIVTPPLRGGGLMKNTIPSAHSEYSKRRAEKSLFSDSIRRGDDIVRYFFPLIE